MNKLAIFAGLFNLALQPSQVKHEPQPCIEPRHYTKKGPGRRHLQGKPAGSLDKSRTVRGSKIATKAIRGQIGLRLH